MDSPELKITEASRLHDLAKNKYLTEISREQRDPAVIEKLRFEMDAALKNYVDSTNEVDLDQPGMPRTTGAG
ncbi:hypothetical protein SAMN04515617_111153 [Collimonas sp. OK242]|jgi:hypothetical protein|uniref:hypothetical protein n=1 Tax=Collimonas sp. OK242 TaxID=1798195 RepID=UPI00089D3C63|nr:hypothetical protein [Collimonas sp. OK242]SDY22969.1 hypothetical protein SAMN04515617_111153 [Collimonas sp. OK242]